MSNEIAKRLRDLAVIIEHEAGDIYAFAVVIVYGENVSISGDLLKMRDEKLLYRAADILDRTP